MSCSFQGSLLHNLFLSSPYLEKKIGTFRAWFTNILRHHRGVLSVAILFVRTWREAVPLRRPQQRTVKESLTPWRLKLYLSPGPLHWHKVSTKNSNPSTSLLLSPTFLVCTAPFSQNTDGEGLFCSPLSACEQTPPGTRHAGGYSLLLQGV